MEDNVSSEEIKIRKVVAADNEALAAMVRKVFDEFGAPKVGTVYADPELDHLYELFLTPRSVLWVAEAAGAPIGICGVYPTPGLDADCAELVKFYLPDTARGRGIGKALLLQCFASAREFGYRSLYIESIPAFAKAVRIYEQSGFVRLAAPMGASAHTSCTIWMLKTLD